MDYLFLKLFEYSNTLKYYNMRDIFEIFREKLNIDIKCNLLYTYKL